MHVWALAFGCVVGWGTFWKRIIYAFDCMDITWCNILP